MSGIKERPLPSLERLGPEAFERLELRRSGVWAIAFLADWCPYCREFVPGFAALGGHSFGVAVADVTSIESPLWERFGIEVVPTVIVFRDGVAGFRADGRYMEGLDANDLRAISAAATSR
jgi:thiol-disulfide isomerase/thioredoxin